jgi:integrase
VGEGGVRAGFVEVRRRTRTRARRTDTLIRRVRHGVLWTDAPGARNRNDVPRRVIVEALILLGPRASELCRWNVAHLDVANCRAVLPFVKTPASERVVPMLPAVPRAVLSTIVRDI